MHRLVAMAFIINPNNYDVVNHKDENPSNNKVDNLEWCTQKYNMNYGMCAKKLQRQIVKKFFNMIKAGFLLKNILLLLRRKEKQEFQMGAFVK